MFDTNSNTFRLPHIFCKLVAISKLRAKLALIIPAKAVEATFVAAKTVTLPVSNYTGSK